MSEPHEQPSGSAALVAHLEQLADELDRRAPTVTMAEVAGLVAARRNAPRGFPRRRGFDGRLGTPSWVALGAVTAACATLVVALALAAQGRGAERPPDINVVSPPGSLEPTDVPDREAGPDGGAAWEPIGLDLPASSSTAKLVDIAASPEQVVILGTTGADGVAWVSDDGEEWELVEPPGMAGAEPMAVKAEPTGFVAVGSASGEARVRHSPNGRDWTIDPGAGFPGVVLEEVASGPNKLVVLGTTSGAQVGWVRDTAGAWIEIESTQLAGVDIDAIETVDGGFVAAGILDDRAAIWESTDGLRWRSASVTVGDDGLDDRNSSIAAIAESPGGLVAVGAHLGHDRSAIAALWYRGDDATWRPAAVAGSEGPLLDVVTNGGSVLAVGQSSDVTSQVGTTWRWDGSSGDIPEIAVEHVPSAFSIAGVAVFRGTPIVIGYSIAGAFGPWTARGEPL